MIFSTEQQAAVTDDQKKLIAEASSLNEQINALDGCDPANADTLASLDDKVKPIRQKLFDQGLTMDEVGNWGPQAVVDAWYNGGLTQEQASKLSPTGN